MENNPLMPANIKLINTKTVLLVAISFVLVFIGGLKAANAASLYFSPSSGSYTVGQTFSAGVYVSSSEQTMNAASGIISFPSDKLQVISLSRTGSIISLWVQEPLFSNSAGTINFEGIVLNPGYAGAAGGILSVNFRVKAAGQAPLAFSSGSVLANDGKGTNILAGFGNAQFSLGGAVPAVPEATTPSAVSGAPSAPVISSPTHPDSEKWYAKSTAKFSWDLPSGTTGTRLLIGKLPEIAPTVTYIPAISFKEVTDLEDGIWYFHARFRNGAGWGETSHFKIQIDTEPPEPFSIEFPDGKETENSRPTIVFEATDSLSGLDYYRVKINESDSLQVPAAAAAFYTLPPQSPGRKLIVIQAYDKAGNYTEASDEFLIKAGAQPVVIEERPAFLKVGSLAIVLIVIVIILVALLYLLWYVWHKFSLFKRRLRKEVHEASRDVHKAFDLLKKDIREQIKLLEKAKTKRQLTKEEDRIIRQLRKDLDDAERFVGKEIEDIEEELK